MYHFESYKLYCTTLYYIESNIKHNINIHFLSYLKIFSYFLNSIRNLSISSFNKSFIHLFVHLLTHWIIHPPFTPRPPHPTPAGVVPGVRSTAASPPTCGWATSCSSRRPPRRSITTQRWSSASTRMKEWHMSLAIPRMFMVWMDVLDLKYRKVVERQILFALIFSLIIAFDALCNIAIKISNIYMRPTELLKERAYLFSCIAYLPNSFHTSQEQNIFIFWKVNLIVNSSYINKISHLF